MSFEADVRTTDRAAVLVMIGDLDTHATAALTAAHTATLGPAPAGT